MTESLTVRQLAALLLALPEEQQDLRVALLDDETQSFGTVDRARLVRKHEVNRFGGDDLEPSEDVVLLEGDYGL